LHIIKRKRWVRSYLEYYFGLTDDGECCILNDGPLPRYLITQVEKLLQTSAVSIECFVTLLHQGVQGGLDDVVLVEVGSIDAEASLLHA
jgi:hypothetical protein